MKWDGMADVADPNSVSTHLIEEHCKWLDGKDSRLKPGMISRQWRTASDDVAGR